MASLKEVKTRIGSVESTKKITQARQMVASAELHRAQSELANASAYKQAVDSMLGDLAGSNPGFTSRLTTPNQEGPVALVAMSSNSGMAGSFNSRIIRELDEPEKFYPGDRLLYFPVGRKIREAWTLAGYEPEGNYDYLMDRPSQQQVSAFADGLVKMFLEGQVRRVDLVSYHFKTMGTQQIVRRTFLPYSFPSAGDGAKPDLEDYYILEPSGEALMEALLPLALVSDFYTALTDNRTSEHAARMLAMQTASENADELLEELRLTYNKVRQQNITTELLDLIGSSFA